MLLIFDCDGVLLDSEVISLAVDVEILAKLGLSYTIDQVARQFLGLSAAEANAIIERELGYPIPDWLDAEHHSRLEAAFKKDLKAMPGVAEFLDRWSGPKCIASSSSLKRLYNTLKQTDLLQRFEPHIYSADMVAHGKPNPDIFLHAASDMGFTPANCIVVEDSVNGVHAACAAGMACFGFVGGGHCDDEHAGRLQEAGAAKIFNKMCQLHALITNHVNAYGSDAKSLQMQAPGKTA